MSAGIGLVRTVASRGALMTGLWWVFLEGAAPKAPLLAALWITAATLASLALVPPGRRGGEARPARRALAAVRFSAYFLREGLLGGVDVLSRAFRPSLPIAPGFVEVELRLDGDGPRAFLAGCVSLLPGTLGADLDGSRLLVHAVDTRVDVERSVRRLEEHVAGLLGRPERKETRWTGGC